MIAGNGQPEDKKMPGAMQLAAGNPFTIGNPLPASLELPPVVPAAKTKNM
jgi:hypothetical protein